MIIRRSLTLLIAGLFCLSTRAGQFLGGEISYQFVSRSGNDFVYNIKLKLYRDCFTEADLPNPIMLEYLNTTDISHNTHPLFYRKIIFDNEVVETLPYSSKDYCVVNDPTACVEIRTYTSQVTLPYSSEGYTFYFSNCCRNGLSNLKHDDGNNGIEIVLNVPVGGEALTYTATIPSHDKVEQNSSPISMPDSVIYACKGYPLRYQFKSIDPDGDSLAYKFSYSLAKVPAATTNFYTLQYNPGFTLGTPAAGSPAIVLDPKTGVISGVPDRAGSFALAINIEEYRNGVLININRKDYQLNVKDCSVAKPKDIVNCADGQVYFDNPNNPANSFHWDFGVPSITTDESIEFAPGYNYPETGTFNVQLLVTNPAGCSETVSSTVKIYPGLSVDFDWSGQACAGNALRFTDRTSPAFGQITSWTWRVMNINRVVSTSRSFDYTHAVSGTMPFPLAMRLTVTSSLGCRDSLLKDILIFENVKANAGPDRILAFDQPYQMSAGTNQVGITYQWSPAFGLNDPTIANPVTTANRDITYTLTVSNPAGCNSSDVVNYKYMKGPEIYVPTGFTPNNDGLNDVVKFYPVGMSQAVMTIYNRWGEVIFSTGDFEKGWDGKVRGILQDTGVYVWMVRAVDFNGKIIIKKGTLVLIR